MARDTNVDYQNIHTESSDGILTLTISREKSLNALNRATVTEFGAALTTVATQLKEDRMAVRAIIVTGAGEKSFVAGGDISEMSGLNPSEAESFSRLGQRTLAQLESLPIPTIAAVNGFALGGGCELAMACDLIYATANAKFGQPEVKLGVIPGFGGTQRLTRRLGPTRARELLFTGDIIDAQKAKEIGLVLEVLAQKSELLEHCRGVAKRIAAQGPLAVGRAKEASRYAEDHTLEEGCFDESMHFGQLFATTDQKEGMKAFLEKRAAKFTGR
jgi:enoyl-CoA hydratase